MTVPLVFLLLVPFQVAHAQAADTASVYGAVRAETATAVAGATVTLLPETGGTPRSIHPDAQGNYRFSDIAAGRYSLRAQISGHPDTTVGPFALDGKEQKHLDLELKSAGGAAPSASAPQFFDEPKFTVAGVTDAGSGGHGSNVVQRNSEALARETAALKNDVKPPNADNETILRERAQAERTRSEARASLAQQDKAESHRLLADADEKLGDPLEAVREYQKAAELEPSESNLFAWGAELLLHNALQPAAEVFSRGNRLFPASTRMLVGLGVTLYAQGAYEPASKRLCEAADLNPNDPAAVLFLGRMLTAGGAPSADVTRSLERFVRAHPDNPQANYYYAVSLWKREQGSETPANVAEVKKLLENAVRLDPRLGAAFLQLGILYAEQKQDADAITAYQNAAAVSPELPEAHFRLAQAYKRAGKNSEAQAEFQIYEQVSRKKNEEVERQRHEMQQFVVTMQSEDTKPR